MIRVRHRINKVGATGIIEGKVGLRRNLIVKKAKKSKIFKIF